MFPSHLKNFSISSFAQHFLQFKILWAQLYSSRIHNIFIQLNCFRTFNTINSEQSRRLEEEKNNKWKEEKNIHENVNREKSEILSRKTLNEKNIEQFFVMRHNVWKKNLQLTLDSYLCCLCLARVPSPPVIDKKKIYKTTKFNYSIKIIAISIQL